MQVGKLNPLGKISFPGFQEILDFTATGSESSVSVAVDGDTDKEYIILSRLSVTSGVKILLNNDSGNNYGDQYLLNNAGSISAARQTPSYMTGMDASKSLSEIVLRTPASFIKTAKTTTIVYSSGTTISQYYTSGESWNNTANVTEIKFNTYSGGNYATGDRIVVYARRSNV